MRKCGFALTVFGAAVSAVLGPRGARRALLRLGADVADHCCDLRLCTIADDVSCRWDSLDTDPSRPIRAPLYCVCGLVLDCTGCDGAGLCR